MTRAEYVSRIKTAKTLDRFFATTFYTEQFMADIEAGVI